MIDDLLDGYMNIHLLKGGQVFYIVFSSLPIEPVT
jgi:hypothetical protein